MLKQGSPFTKEQLDHARAVVDLLPPTEKRKLNKLKLKMMLDIKRDNRLGK